ncbi:MAG TPA: hypothetical protein VJC21_05060 [Candidatus Nanoarchaeia archaeon]|nr:hypothetical protein [Candidatus Nanoarchaeia archaeon]
MVIALIVGLVGMACILAGFLLDEFTKQFNRNNLGYNALNFLGAVLLGAYAFSLRAWPFLMLNGVWAVAALIRGIALVRR